MQQRQPQRRPQYAVNRTTTNNNSSSSSSSSSQLLFRRRVPSTTTPSSSSSRSTTRAFVIIAVVLITILIVLLLLLVIVVGYNHYEPDDPKHTLKLVGVEVENGRGQQQLQQSQLTFAMNATSMDYTHYTVRINTWDRPGQLQAVIQHYLTCSSVAQVQVVWCIDQGPVPMWLQSLENDDKDEQQQQGATTTKSSLRNAQQPPPSHRRRRVVVERHTINSLNARFDLQNTPPTAGILSTDDDVVRPCMALESAFLLWTCNPDRQVGFDARSHGTQPSAQPPQRLVPRESEDEQRRIPIDKNRWSYAYMSTTEKTNLYSMTLTRHSFQHRDYLLSYTHDMPQTIRDRITQHMNCEDIAMSFWISSLTQGLPPLLADYWCVKSQIKLYVASKISGGSNHKSIRDSCVNDFADMLELKDRLQLTRLRHISMNAHFEYGIKPTNWNQISAQTILEQALPVWYQTLQNTMAVWKRPKHDDGGDSDVWMSQLAQLRRDAAQPLYDEGWIENTGPWKKRFHHHSTAK